MSGGLNEDAAVAHFVAVEPPFCEGVFEFAGLDDALPIDTWTRRVPTGSGWLLRAAWAGAVAAGHLDALEFAAASLQPGYGLLGLRNGVLGQAASQLGVGRQRPV